MNVIRSLVSENRNRYIEKDVNLDLTYITSRIVAMSYPSEGFEGLYRNPFNQVKKFLDNKHAGHYKVYNLRKEKQYDLSRFENAANFPFLDHQAPSFDTLVDFCMDASAWLDKDKENVVVIHCKAGKGRTGTVIAALLLDMGQAKDAQEAIDLYGKYRTKNQRGITIPSQIRYVYYYDFMRKNKQLYYENKHISINITQMVIHDLPESLKHNKAFDLRVLDIDDATVYQTSSSQCSIDRTLDTILIHLVDLNSLTFDFKVLFLNAQGNPLFSFWLNPTFMYMSNHSVLCLQKHEIDLAFRDKACKDFSRDFSVGITFHKE
ncbi:the Pten tumor suppressor [Mucor lusitanicus]|uniref:Phosphatidylinositol 3,4,5-trisphosphate 3-phosphatase and dual-specificity protein phosphatase PTEN n=1 Tax=Mucor circinelloides f. lusitanicus TaxID=29924 RepID=A0A8H4BTG1_MUCCL|nr:the Pten tumor suppressor [Mucor lusitanicus]